MRLLANNMIRKVKKIRFLRSFDDFLFLIFLCLIFQNIIIVDFTFLLSRKSRQFHLAGIMLFIKIKMQKVYKDIAR